MSIWSEQPLQVRVRQLRFVLPPVLILLVVGYQLGFARLVEAIYGHAGHYGVEIGFYSLIGPLVTWLTLVWMERQLTEKEILESSVHAHEQLLAKLTAFSADAIISLDENNTITSWNRGAEYMFGYTASEILQQPLRKILPELPAATDTETTVITAEGRRIPVSFTQTQIATAADEPPITSLILRDITAQRERAAIIEEERARIARDLHDGVAQTLYFLALNADMASQQLSSNPDSVANALRDIGQKARAAIQDVRRTIFSLRPLDWTTGGFLPAMKRFVHEFAEQAGWRITIDLPETLTIPPRLEPTIFRLIQESLNNVAKHAKASRVRITIQPDAPASILRLTITDDGIGFSAPTSNGGLGIQQMKQRVLALNGEFSIDSQLGQGTIVSVSLPV